MRQRPRFCISINYYNVCYQDISLGGEFRIGRTCIYSGECERVPTPYKRVLNPSPLQLRFELLNFCVIFKLECCLISEKTDILLVV